MSHPDYAGVHAHDLIYLQAPPVSPRVSFAEGFSEPAPEPDPAARSVGVFQLRPGKAVTGILQSSDGKPLAGVKVIGHSQVPKNERGISARTSAGETVRSTAVPEPSVVETETDSAGKFSVTMITPGEAMLAIFPADSIHTPHFEFVYEQRGDLGVIKLPRGEMLQGRVFARTESRSTACFSLPNLGSCWLRSIRMPVSSKCRFGRPLPTRTANSRSTRWRPANIELLPTSNSPTPRSTRTSGSTTAKCPACSHRKKSRLSSARRQRRWKFCALETVAVQGRVIFNVNANLNAANLDAQQQEQLQQVLLQNRARFAQQSPLSIQGKANALLYKQRISIDEAGNFKALVPKGLREAEIALLTPVIRGGVGGGFGGGPGDVSHAGGLTWRIGNNGEAHTEPRIDLGTLNADVSEIEIDFSQVGRRAGGAAAGAAGGGFGGGRGGAVNQAPGNVAPAPVVPPAADGQ